MSKFKPVSSQVDFPAMERELLDYWHKEGIVEKYLNKNQSSDKKFSFLDGPITANNPMGVHHAWGRTYKDLWQRFFNMQGYKQRFQNGFDEQGLWVEVEVEKELNLKSKKEIENLVPGDKFKSLEKFINLCKERVKKYSAIQTEQSKRLGYFMDWANSYHTSSDENNFAIWNFLKVVSGKGWLYKGRDSVPWCPRCGTAISQHEILQEEYKEITHESVVVKFPIAKDEYLLAWTTTPWSLPGTIALMVNPDFKYVKVQQGEEKYILAKERLALLKGNYQIIEEFTGQKLVGMTFVHPFQELPVLKNIEFTVIPAKEFVTLEVGTGIVTNNPGVGHEDYLAAKANNITPVESINEEANFLTGYDFLTGRNAKDKEVTREILDRITKKNLVYDIFDYLHRYPVCWRCKTELVFRLVDEWYIAMDKNDSSGKTYREQMVEVVKKINWMPKWGLDRELDWLKNMQDWLISKKRYWGLALPIWECNSCGNFEVVGSKEELKKKAVEGWKEFEGNSPHRPWVDQIKIRCTKCEQIASRIPDVGNPWLDAGIVPFSTMPEGWFPADFVTEAFPGQFKNWFYALIAMSTALRKTNPFKNLLGHALVMDEKGAPMHKSAGNMIEFNEAADKIGVDVMRWIYVTQNPEYNLNFGYKVADEVRRRFYLILWNSYKFFVDYANLAGWPARHASRSDAGGEVGVLDKWILAKLNQLIFIVSKGLEKYDAVSAARAIEDFVVQDFSTWYIRRSRDRVKVALPVMYEVLVTLSKLLAPFMLFISEEIFKNLVNEESVHLQSFPEGKKELVDEKLIGDMVVLRKIAEAAHAKRKEAGIKLRQPLASITYKLSKKLEAGLEEILAQELNVKKVEYQKSPSLEPQVILDTKITRELEEEGKARELIRQVQQNRKEQNMTLSDKTKIIAPDWPKAFEKEILSNTASVSIETGSEFMVIKDEITQTH